MRCIGDVIQELLAAHENGRDVNLVTKKKAQRNLFHLYTLIFLVFSQTEPCEDSDCVEVLAGDEPAAGGHHRGGAIRAQEGARAQAEGEASQDGERGELGN